MKKVELLAPAKDYRSALAAVEAGADALYIGGSRFGARRMAANAVDEIARTVAMAHPYGVRVYATLNTLLRDDELADAEAEARALIAAGVDALIIQDMALRRLNLPVELHASTQVSNRTPEGARFLAEAGFARVILERALSLEEIRAICDATTAEVECFVHGAICVGYSGRCFLSRSMSERSGNRGACSQPCRLTWDLTDGHGKTYLSRKHLLSVRDLNLSPRIGEMLDAGVTSFKIEGRLKEAEYVRNVVAWYRREIDRALATRPTLCRASIGESTPDFEPDPAKSFTRGESTYYFDRKQRGVASFDTPKAIGERIGRIARLGRRDFTLEAGSTPLSPGDGICFLRQGEMVGTNVNAAEGLRILPNRMEGLQVGTEIYRNYDHRFVRQLQTSRMRRVIPLTAVVDLSAAHLSLTVTDPEGVTATASRTGAFEPARNVEANRAAIQSQVERCGNTPFAMREVALTGAEYFVPTSTVADLRREVLEALQTLRAQQPVPRRPLPENLAAPYPTDRLTEVDNVTNRLAEAFYRDHGVKTIAPPLELAASMRGYCVMRSAYCLRRELGECLREQPRLKGDLYLEHGGWRYRLAFDCERCEMSLIQD